MDMKYAMAMSDQLCYALTRSPWPEWYWEAVQSEDITSFLWTSAILLLFVPLVMERFTESKVFYRYCGMISACFSLLVTVLLCLHRTGKDFRTGEAVIYGSVLAIWGILELWIGWERKE